MARNRFTRLVATAHGADALIAAGLICVCGWLWWQTLSFDAVNPLLAQGVPPERFPRLILAVIALLALLLPFERRLAGNEFQKLEDDRSAPVPRASWLAVVAMLVIALLASLFGTVLTVLCMCLFMPPIWDERRAGVILFFAMTVTGVLVALFAGVFGVPMDPGIYGIRFPLS